jgi:hypothetical protein
MATSTAFSSALIAGGLAGTAVDTLFFPIDTLKTRAQSQAGFLASGGFTGVYRGLSSAVVGSAPGGKLSLARMQGRAQLTLAPPAAAFFTSYETLKGQLPLLFPQLGTEEFAPALHMLSASGGEVVSPASPSPSVGAEAELISLHFRTDGMLDSSTNRSGQATESNSGQRNRQLVRCEGGLDVDGAQRLLPRVRQHCCSRGESSTTSKKAEANPPPADSFHLPSVPNVRAHEARPGSSADFFRPRA